MGIPAHLVDGVSEIQKSWFERVESVLITAGASAPEDVVQECIDYLVSNHGASIEEALVRQENVHFPLPRSLRELLPAGTQLPVVAEVDR
jgi:4-hydroxy-3-methylbut-2-enyl diphosphate reductase